MQLKKFNETKFCDWLSRYSAYRYFSYFLAFTLLFCGLFAASFKAVCSALYSTYDDFMNQFKRYIRIMKNIESTFH